LNLADTRLGPILEAVSARMQERRAAGGLERLLERDLGQPTGGRSAFVDALRDGGLSILAEHKRNAPSAGVLEVRDSVEERCSSYARQGASALSVLTEQDAFDGELEHLIRAAIAGLPRLRKDFILDPWMVEESAAAGADAVLLMAVCLEGALLHELTCAAHESGIAVLCEVHDAEELERALDCGADCIGVNARDLRTFEIDLQTTLGLLPQVSVDRVRVAESGLVEFGQLLQVRNAGADAALIGTALMQRPERCADWVERLQEEAS
jgi:indole-3-glycerol phosphate synthase